MRILLVADEESKFIWDYYDASLFNNIDLVISAGDLKAKYLSFLTTMTMKPVYYVFGNHDNNYTKEPPYGCDPIDDQIIVQNGIRILGLGGSYRYKSGPYQYTEKQMRKRIKKLHTMINQFSGVDILVTHAPPKGHGDGEDLCHTGFDVFNEFINTYKPSYLLHGHQHLNYGRKADRIQIIDSTTLINGFNYHIFDYLPNQVPYQGLKGISKLLNSINFHMKYYGTHVMHEYKKYKRFNKYRS